MKRRLWTRCRWTVVSLCLLAPLGALAEVVSHHQSMIEANSPAQVCIACHDGTSAKHVSYCRVKCDFSGAHSLFKHYPPAGQRDKFASAAEVIAKGVHLQSGRVTCISCHDLRNPARHHLVMDNTDSKLCMICHLTK